MSLRSGNVKAIVNQTRKDAGNATSGVLQNVSLIKSFGGEDGTMPRPLDLVSVVKLEFLLTYPAVEGHPSRLGWVVLSRLYASRVDAEEKREAHSEASKGEEDPVLRHPEDEPDVVAVPAIAKVVREEAPRVVVVLVGEEDANSIIAHGVSVVVVSPDHAQEEGSSGGHDGNVRQNPSSVVVWKGIDGLQEEGVARDGTHGIVGNTCGGGAADPSWIGQKRVEAAVASLKKISGALTRSAYMYAYIVQINVDTSKVV